MNRKFLEDIWDRGVRAGIGRGEGALGELELPRLDEAQEIVGFIDEMGLKYVARMQNPLTEEGAAWLLSRYPKDLIMEILCEMDNYKGLNRKYTTAKLTCNSWCKRRQKSERSGGGHNAKIPVT